MTCGAGRLPTKGLSKLWKAWAPKDKKSVKGTKSTSVGFEPASFTVCAKGPSQHPTKLGLAKYFRCLSRRRRERHQEYVCGTRTSLHSAVGAHSTVCAKGPTHTPTKLRPAKHCRWCSTIEAKYPFELKSENLKDVGINPCTSYISYIRRCPRSPRFGKPFRWKTVHPTSHPFLPFAFVTNLKK
ncbi:uncharacterized protein LOC144066736 isoform X1 [Stigmatopora argus]